LLSIDIQPAHDTVSATFFPRSKLGRASIPDITGSSADRKSPSNQQFGVAAPKIALPKGGGALHGIGEKFAANPVTGTGSLTVPIAVSPGRARFSPQLALSYDSGAGNGPFGLGFSLSFPTITRRTDKGLPKYQDDEESDVFITSRRSAGTRLN
jgi:Salmonella virulence plasmid 65kDa B protein